MSAIGTKRTFCTAPPMSLKLTKIPPKFWPKLSWII